MSEAITEASELLPLDMLDAAAGLADPATVLRAMPWLAGELAKVALGRSDVWFGERDKRFADRAAQERAAAVVKKIARWRATRPTLGNREYPPLGTAPGTYART